MRVRRMAEISSFDLSSSALFRFTTRWIRYRELFSIIILIVDSPLFHPPYFILHFRTLPVEFF